MKSIFGKMFIYSFVFVGIYSFTLFGVSICTIAREL